jgi:hypothetical protein
MLFCEANGTMRPLPEWARFLIRLGYSWPVRGNDAERRIALISMPCDSAAAGLIVLGGMIRDLGDPQANDFERHYDRLLLNARQHLQSCRNCDQRCHPESVRCGYAKEATGKLRSLRAPHTGYHVCQETDLEQRQLVIVRHDVIYRPEPQYATNYYISDEPPPTWNAPDGALSDDAYAQIVPECQVRPDNLRRSYSGLCLAGRMGGENASRELCASVSFRSSTLEHSLEELLTIYGWSACNISRIVFFNTRTGEMDRNVGAPRLTVADGDASFLNVISHPEFRNGDIVGVIHRVMERDRLEALGNKMTAMQQWYVQDEDMLCELPEVPRGISISILKRRI